MGIVLYNGDNGIFSDVKIKIPDSDLKISISILPVTCLLFYLSGIQFVQVSIFRLK